MPEFTVVIAEDEQLIRNGIVASVDWNALGVEVTGLARNGREALEAIRERPTDILLTDIRMAMGDGLELIKNAKLVNPDIRAVIISGYNSFAYAQQAIQLGVKDYLLKPIDIDKLRSILEKLTKEIRETREARKDLDRLESFYQENRQLQVNEFFRDLLFGAVTGAELGKKQSVYEVSGSRNFYVPLILYAELRNPIEWGELKNRLKEVTAPVFGPRGIAVESLFFMPNEVLYTDITLVLSADGTTFDLGRLLPEIRTAVEKILEVALLALGVGEICERLEDLVLSYQKAKTHALFSMITGMKTRSDQPGAVPEPPSVNVYETTKELIGIFSGRGRNELRAFFASIERQVNDANGDMARKKLLLRNLFVCVLSAGDELGVPIREIFPDLMALYRYINLKPLPELLQKIRWAADTIVSQQQTREERVGIDLMDRAKSYILENYTDPLISLETVSAHLSLTPAYFSRLYKKAHGASYIETVTSLRLEKALGYLANNPGMKISSVAAHVGYNSASYFNFIFKKYYGVPPLEYMQKEHGT